MKNKKLGLLLLPLIPLSALGIVEVASRIAPSESTPIADCPQPSTPPSSPSTAPDA